MLKNHPDKTSDPRDRQERTKHIQKITEAITMLSGQVDFKFLRKMKKRMQRYYW